MSNWNYKIEGGYTHVITTIMKAQKEHYFYTDDYTIKMLLAKIEDGEAKIKEEGAKYLYDDIISGEYIRYYTNYTFKFDFKSWSHQWTKVNNYKHDIADPNVLYKAGDTVNKVAEEHWLLGKYITNIFANNSSENKVTAKEIETGKKVYKYVVTYESKPILVEDTGHYITLETGCYKWVEE